MRSALLMLGFLSATALSSPAHALDPRPGAKVRALEKITGNATDIEIQVGETVQFGGIGLTVRACYQSPPEEQPPESAAYIEVISMGVNPETGKSNEKDPRMFSGWMFASSPGRNALENPLYDVWVTSCSAAPPEIEDDGEPAIEGEILELPAEDVYDPSTEEVVTPHRAEEDAPDTSLNSSDVEIDGSELIDLDAE